MRRGGGAGHEEHVILVGWGGAGAGVVGRSLGAGGMETCGRGICLLVYGWPAGGRGAAVRPLLALSTISLG